MMSIDVKPFLEGTVEGTAISHEERTAATISTGKFCLEEEK